MNFVVNVTDDGLDSLPQDLPFAVFDLLVGHLETELGSNPIGRSERACNYNVGARGNVYFGGFKHNGNTYLFAAYFYFEQSEEAISVWRIVVSVE